MNNKTSEAFKKLFPIANQTSEIYPFPFDIQYYRETHSELQIFPDKILEEHYRRFAKKQGLSCCVWDRREKCIENLKSLTWARILEIGPSERPLVRGNNVRYFDVLDTKEMKERSILEGGNPENVPFIDYHEPNGDMSVIDERFEIVLGSHSIEHQTDLIRHLQMVEHLLSAGGFYLMFIPDYRYIFDYYRKETAITEIISAYEEKRRFHSLQAIIDGRCTVTHNDCAEHWLGNHGTYDLSKESLNSILQEYRDNKDHYIDAHEWKFTPDSFAFIISKLKELGLINLSIYQLSFTLFGRHEFIAILHKPE